VADCDQLTHLQIEAEDAGKIQIGYIDKLKTFCLDLSCKKCILELDRYDVRAFYFATVASQLESFYLRTGTQSESKRDELTHKRY
jgi:hypothetical protein